MRFNVILIAVIMLGYGIGHCEENASEGVETRGGTTARVEHTLGKLQAASATGSQISNSSEAEHFNIFLSPLYNPHQSSAWNFSKAAAFAASALDASSTSGALRRGYYERSITANWLIRSNDPAPVKRQLLAFGIQYGYNLALDTAWRHAHSKKDKVLVLVTRWGLTGISIWAVQHNRGNK